MWRCAIEINLIYGLFEDGWTDWLVDWLTNWLTDRLTGWLVDWLNDCLVEWLTDWLTQLLSKSNRMINVVIGGLGCWLNNRPTDEQAGLLLDWLMDWKTRLEVTENEMTVWSKTNRSKCNKEEKAQNKIYYTLLHLKIPIFSLGKISHFNIWSRWINISREFMSYTHNCSSRGFGDHVDWRLLGLQSGLRGDVRICPSNATYLGKSWQTQINLKRRGVLLKVSLCREESD